MSPLTIQEEGTAQVAARLDGVASRSRDAKPAMQKVRQILEAGNRKTFETSGSYLGEAWAELRPGTLARKARKGQDSRILRATGALEASLTGGKGRRGGASKTQARAGTAIWYAVFAQAGTKTAPRRRVVGLTKRDRMKSVRTVDKYILTGEIFP